MDKKVIKILEEEYGYELPYESHIMNKLILDVIEATKKSLKVPKFNFRQALIDYGFLPNLVDEWLQVRRTKRLTNTETAFKSFISELEKRHDSEINIVNINEVLKEIVNKSWGGFKWSWIDNLNKQQNGQQIGTKAGQQHPLQNILDLSNRVLQDPRS